MANYFARKTGNINATDVWATTPTGTAAAQTFVAGDVLYANSFTITVNVTTNLGSTGEVRNDNTNSATAGGGFTLSDGVTLTANAFAGSTGTACVTYNGTAAVTFVGNSTGGSGSSAVGVSNTSTGTLTITGNVTGGSGGTAIGANNTSTGTLTITGNVTGGSGGTALGTNNASNGTLTITGNVTGGSGSGAEGARNTSAGTLTITGNVTGGSNNNAFGAINNSTGTITINGTATGGTQAAGASNSSTGTLNVTRAKGNDFGIGSTGRTLQTGVNGAQSSFTYVREIEFGDLGSAPVTGNIMLTDSTSNVCVFYRYNTTKKTITDPAATVDYPANSNVRSGTVFANGNRTGTLAVPGAGSVALGVAVDSGFGTAVLTPANVWEYSVATASAVTGSLGQRLARSARTTDVIAFS